MEHGYRVSYFSHMGALLSYEVTRKTFYPA